MKAVFEKESEGIATFIVDNLQKTYTMSSEELPEDLKIGDVVEVRIENEELVISRNLPEERKRREDRIRQKREELLKRSKK